MMSEWRQDLATTDKQRRIKIAMTVLNLAAKVLAVKSVVAIISEEEILLP